MQGVNKLAYRILKTTCFIIDRKCACSVGDRLIHMETKWRTFHPVEILASGIKISRDMGNKDKKYYFLKENTMAAIITESDFKTKRPSKEEQHAYKIAKYNKCLVH